MFNVGVSAIQGDRHYQEDSFVITDPLGTDQSIEKLDRIALVVADGVGGEAAGAVASRMASQVAAEYLQSTFNQDINDASPEAIHKIFSQMVLAINEQFKDTLTKNPDYDGMATTLVTGLIIGNKLYWLSIGDSHLYVVRKNQLRKVNADHSMAAVFNDHVQNGDMSYSDAQNHPDRNNLLSYIDGHQVNEQDISAEPIELQDGDLLLLATDGLDSLSGIDILKVLDNHNEAQAVAQALTDKVEQYDYDGQDNTTVVVLKYSEKQN